MISHEYWSDEEIGGWSHTARLFYIALWNFADDEGRFKAHDVLLKSQAFPYDERVSIKQLKEEISKKVIWYEVSGSQYGYLKNFLSYQRIDRPTASKLPEPPEKSNIKKEVKVEKLPSITASIDYLDSRECIDKLESEFKVYGIKNELAKMKDYCKAHGKRYKDYLSFARNWLRSANLDKKKVVKTFDKELMSEEKRIKNLEKLNEIKQQFSRKED